jgi:hypothetical protein
MKAVTIKRVGFQEPTLHSIKADDTLDVTLASRLQLAKWYDEPEKYISIALFGEPRMLEDELSNFDAKGYIKGFRTGIRRELDARNQALASRRKIVSKARRTITYITAPIEQFRSMINTTRKPLDF